MPSFAVSDGPPRNTLSASDHPSQVPALGLQCTHWRIPYALVRTRPNSGLPVRILLQENFGLLLAGRPVYSGFEVHSAGYFRTANGSRLLIVKGSRRCIQMAVF